MIAGMLTFEMKGPVGLPVTAGANRSKLEHGLGAVEPPSSAGESHSVLHQVATRAFDDSGGDGKSLLEVAGIVNVDRVLVQVLDGVVEGSPVFAREPSKCRFLTNGRHDVERVLREQLLERARRPGFGGALVGGREKDPDRPDVVKDVEQIQHDEDAHLPATRFGLDVRELVFVAVDEHDGFSVLSTIASLRLIEHLRNSDGETVLDAGSESLVLRTGRLR